MTERLLQFIWQFQYYNTANLTTTLGEPLQIITQGKLNTNQGPDFLHAKIIIGNTTWVGNIELHLASSDWLAHQHSSDTNYSNIILHVVWQNDGDVIDGSGSILPALLLSSRVPKILIDRYEALMHSQDFVPSQQHLPALSKIGWLSWKERLVAERLQRKSQTVIAYLKDAGNHWEQVFWWMLARNFGIKVNADIFESIARSIPINILARHKNQIHQLEGLLLGQAGLLQGSFAEDYPKLLQREYAFYQKKYALKPLSVKPFFLRMRPANFPTIRLAQLAMVIHKSSHLFTQIKEADSISAIKTLLSISANDYWHYHYLFDQPVAYKPKQLGRQTINNIIINTIVPVLFAYGLYANDETLKQKTLRWLSELPPEKNTITKQWQRFGVDNENALESQALLELKNNYCNQFRCLECAVGNRILKATH